MLMNFIFLVGTIFPQGENIDDYIEAGGKYVAIVRAFDFLDIFSSPLFMIATAVLILNLVICLYDRLKIFLRIRRKPLNFQTLKNHPNVMTFIGNNIEDRLRKTGFRLKVRSKGTTEPGVQIYEKGLPFWLLSWLYHVGIILAILGFFVTYLFAFEEAVVLYKDKPVKISLYSKETRWNKFFGNTEAESGIREAADEFALTLKDFRTEYYQGLKIDYPRKKYERFMMGIGLRKTEPVAKKFSYMPKMWFTSLEVERPDGKVIDAALWVNSPFRTGSLTLYQMGYEQKAELSVGDEIKEVEARVPFQIEGVSGEFALGPIKLGTLFRRDGTIEKITPETTVYYIPEENPSEREVIDNLVLGKSIKAKGKSLEFRDYTEGSYLSYRKDPGVWVVGLACLFVFLGLFIRSLGAWYRVQYACEKKTAYVLISSRGILADRDRIIKKLSK